MGEIKQHMSSKHQSKKPKNKKERGTFTDFIRPNACLMEQSKHRVRMVPCYNLLQQSLAKTRPNSQRWWWMEFKLRRWGSNGSLRSLVPLWTQLNLLLAPNSAFTYRTKRPAFPTCGPGEEKLLPNGDWLCQRWGLPLRVRGLEATADLQGMEIQS